jgi:DNA helicase-2/ATP-dependent DNA helicase PcrA
MIYVRLPGRHGVGPIRLTTALARPGAQRIDLPLGSHRDPTQLLPTVAEAVRVRNFSHPSLAYALAARRLRIINGIDDDPAVDAVCDAMEQSKQTGARSFGIFVHGNEPTSSMSAALTDRGVDHVVVGLSESYGEALSTFATMLQFAIGQAAWEDVLARLAVFYTSTVRSKYAPPLAFTIGIGHADGLLGRRLGELRDGLAQAPNIETAAPIAGASWPTLALGRGNRPWWRAVAEVTRLITVSGGVSASVDAIRRQVEVMRAESFTEIDAGDKSPVQLMNLHQTKGREADAIIALFRSGDYFGNEQEPFESASRLLYVVLTRARHQVTLLLPTRPHALVAPFARL